MPNRFLTAPVITVSAWVLSTGRLRMTSASFTTDDTGTWVMNRDFSGTITGVSAASRKHPSLAATTPVGARKSTSRSLCPPIGLSATQTADAWRLFSSRVTWRTSSGLVVTLRSGTCGPSRLGLTHTRFPRKSYSRKSSASLTARLRSATLRTRTRAEGVKESKGRVVEWTDSSSGGC